MGGCGLVNPAKVDYTLSGAPYRFSLSEDNCLVFTAEILKWDEGHQVAVSTTYDNPWAPIPTTTWPPMRS